MRRLGSVLAVALVAALLGIGGGLLATDRADRPVAKDPPPTSPGTDPPSARPTYSVDEDPEGIGALLQNQPCDPNKRKALVPVGWGNKYGSLSSAAAQWPKAKYLRTSESCDTHWPSVAGETSQYVVYLEFPDARSACQERMTGGHKGDTVVRLREGNAIPVMCPCALSNGEMPTLRPYAKAFTTRERMFLTAYQRMLMDLGYLELPRDIPRGDFDDLTRLATLDLQTDRGLSPTGIVGPQTWSILQARACELYDF